MTEAIFFLRTLESSGLGKVLFRLRAMENQNLWTWTIQFRTGDSLLNPAYLVSSHSWVSPPVQRWSRGLLAEQGWSMSLQYLPEHQCPVMFTRVGCATTHLPNARLSPVLPQGPGDEPVRHNPQGPRADQEKPVQVVARMRGACVSLKEIMFPVFLQPWSNPIPDFPVSFRIPQSWAEAKYKIKAAHSRAGWSGGMPEEGRASPS